MNYLKNVKQILVLLIVATLLFSCSNDDDNEPSEPNTEELLIAKWKLISGTGLFGGDYQSNDSNCEDIFFQYKTNNTLDLILSVDDNQDGSCEEGVAITSTWSLNNEAISITNDGITNTVDIISINSSALRVKGRNEGDIEQFYAKE